MSDQTMSILNLQDSELANSMHKLNSDPAKLNSFIAKRKSDVYKSITKGHSNNFEKVYGDLTRASEGTKNVLHYHTRNNDLDKLKQDEYNKLKNEVDKHAFNNQNAKRQYEINEWTANNKLDTLFFLQLLLIVLTILAPLIYANKIGVIPSSVYYGISSLLGIAVILTLLVRLQYNTKSRDTRFWNRRRFAKMGGPPTTTISCDALSSLTTEAQDSLHSVEDSVTSGISNLGNTVRTTISNDINDLAINMTHLSNGPAPAGI